MNKLVSSPPEARCCESGVQAKQLTRAVGPVNSTLRYKNKNNIKWRKWVIKNMSNTSMSERRDNTVELKDCNKHLLEIRSFSNPKLLFTPTEKYLEMVISMTFQTNIKLYSISVPRRIFSEQKGFLTVNVHNSKTRTLRNEDSALQRNAQHISGWRWCNFISPLLRGGQIGAQLRCNLPWRHSRKTRLKTALWLRSTNAINK